MTDQPSLSDVPIVHTQEKCGKCLGVDTYTKHYNEDGEYTHSEKDSPEKQEEIHQWLIKRGFIQ